MNFKYKGHTLKQIQDLLLGYTSRKFDRMFDKAREVNAAALLKSCRITMLRAIYDSQTITDLRDICVMVSGQDLDSFIDEADEIAKALGY